MKVMADENMDAAIIAWLRDQGHDVLSVMESMRGAGDDEILSRANEQSRIILTKDMDFGEMVFFDKLPSAGVILLRIQAGSARRLATIQSRWTEIAEHAPGHFVVVSENRLRLRKITSRHP